MRPDLPHEFSLYRNDAHMNIRKPDVWPDVNVRGPQKLWNNTN